MSDISSINTSFYPELAIGFEPTTTLPVPAVTTESSENYNGYSESYSNNTNEDIDLSNYYNDVRPEDLLTKSGQYLVESRNRLDNSMVIAMQNGYSVQDVCNIRLAEMAYKVNAYVFDIAEDMSTFNLKI